MVVYFRGRGPKGINFTLELCKLCVGDGLCSNNFVANQFDGFVFLAVPNLSLGRLFDNFLRFKLSDLKCGFCGFELVISNVLDLSSGRLLGKGGFNGEKICERRFP